MRPKAVKPDQKCVSKLTHFKLMPNWVAISRLITL